MNRQQTQAIPTQIQLVPADRRAWAPYNFVALPEKPVRAESFPDGRCYDPNRLTGTIDCTLTTASPLYVRGILTTEEFAAGQEGRDVSDFFALDPRGGRPVIPGSTLRGMLRGLVEIVSYGKMERVSDTQRFFFRAVAAKGDDPLRRAYRLGTVKAGYLDERNGCWYIRPARQVNGQTYVWVSERDVIDARLPDYKPMERGDYVPQYIAVTFDRVITKQRSGRLFAKDIGLAGGSAQYRGALVTSGNMRETGDANWPLERKNHCIVGERDDTATPLEIESQAVQDYRSALTAFQQQDPPFDETMGVLRAGRPIFYSVPGPGKPVTFFGQSPNFRIPYRPSGRESAATAVDFIPASLRDRTTVDMAEAIFGYVRGAKQEDDQARAGRVFVGDAVCQQTAHDDIWLTGDRERAMTPRILTSPKPTTFQHYLVQTNVEQRDLKHYASTPEKETVIRGHKLYWHKDNVRCAQVEASPADVANAPSQYTSIKPVKAAVPFKFSIRFENLSLVELGALLWVLRLASEEDYRLSLGMGKPYGLGAVSITHTLCLSNRKQRYSTLFADEGAGGWESGDDVAVGEREYDYSAAFEGYVLKGIGADPGGVLRDQPRIRQLLALLRWPGPPPEQTRYMTIEPNEYRDRPVLPDPSLFDRPPSAPQAGQTALPSTEPKRDAGEPQSTSSTSPVDANGQPSPPPGTNATPLRSPLSREERERRRHEALEGLTVGEWREGRVTSVVPFGAFVDLGGIDGLVHISQLGDGGYVAKAEDVVRPGQIVRVRVIEVDRDRRRIGLSMREERPRRGPDRPRPHEGAPTPTPTAEPQPEVTPTAPPTVDDEPTVMGERLMELGVAPSTPTSSTAPDAIVDPRVGVPEHKASPPSIAQDARQSGGVRPPLQPGAIIGATVSTINRTKFKMAVNPQVAPEEVVQVSNVTFTDMQNIKEGDIVRVQIDKNDPHKGTLKRKG